MSNRAQGHLPRLASASYRGRVSVHWTMTIEGRRRGWLTPDFAPSFRELLTHATFRYALSCPIYCLMPDHLHMMWVGIDDRTDQLKASKYFRKLLGSRLAGSGFALQHQAHDRVLREDERSDSAFEDLVAYIARNPERTGLVAADRYREYEFTGCLVPGYPELSLWQDDYWPRFWRALAFLQRHGLTRWAEERLT